MCVCVFLRRLIVKGMYPRLLSPELKVNTMSDLPTWACVGI